MATDQKMLKCKTCHRVTLHIQRTWGSGAHLVLTVLTFGLWLLFWAAGVGKSQPECTVCGRVQPRQFV